MSVCVFYHDSLVHCTLPDLLLSFQEVLDADENPLIDRSGRRMQRDIVQFVPLRKFHSRSGSNFSLVSKKMHVCIIINI